MKIDNIEKLLKPFGESKVHLEFNEKAWPLTIESEPECVKHCPAGVNVKSYVGLIAGKDYDTALEVIRKANPFPGICGRVCTHPCEVNCQYPDRDNPLSIKRLKRFAADYEITNRQKKLQPCPVKYKDKIAVIGAGPAGLTAAADLVKLGYQVTVFEAMSRPGGILRWGIPEFRLPSDITDYETGMIESLGVKIILNTKIDNPVSLLTEGFSAVIIAAGAWESLKLGIKGEELRGVDDCLEFLRKARSGTSGKIEGKVVVVGGGNSAMDSARTALRLGAEKVTVAYRRTVDEMPADKVEVQEAQEEGIELITLAIPEKVIGSDKVKEVEFIKAKLGEPDSSGRRRPVPVEGSYFKIKCDILIPAISSAPYLPFYEKYGIELTKKGLIKTDDKLLTSVKKVFATGDVVLGPSTVVDVVGNAHKCAESVHRTLRRLRKQVFEKRASAVIKNPDGACQRRCAVNTLSSKERLSSISTEVEPVFSEFSAIKEALRCRKCASCYECDICLPVCEYKLALLSDRTGKYLLKLPRELSKNIYDSNENDCLLVGEKGKSKNLHIIPLTPKIDKKLCIACGRCANACAYRAIRAELKKDDVAYYTIEHDICRSCGRCIFVCPSQAVNMNLYSDPEIDAEIYKSIQYNNGIVVFGSHWALRRYMAKDYVIELMSDESVTPLMIVHSIALGAKGVAVLYDPLTPHYLPITDTPEKIVNEAKELLSLDYINPERIILCATEDAERNLPALKEAFRYEAAETFADTNSNRIMRAWNELSGYASQTWRPVNYLRLQNKVLKAAGVPDYSEVIEGLKFLTKRLKLGIKKPDAEHIYDPEFIRQISDNLPSLSLTKPALIGIHNEFRPSEYVELLVSVIAKIQNCAVITIPDVRDEFPEHTTITSESRSRAVAILRTAEDCGADTIITTSPMCLAWLKAVNNPDAIQISSVKVRDIFSFLAELIEKGT